MRYDGPIIDAHHHLWDLSLGRHHWLAVSAGQRGGLGDLASLRRNYLPEDYRRDAVRQNVVGSVHVEAGWASDDCLGETRWLETLDKTNRIADRYVVHVPLASAQAPALIEAQARFSRVVGVRDILSWSEDPARRFAARGDFIDDPQWRSGLARLKSHELAFELMVFPDQLAQAEKLERDFPNQLLVLNHCGSPIDRDPEGMLRWRKALASLGRAPNVSIKISDLVAYDHHWTLESLAEVVLHCLECFGVARAMFASDFPVARLHASFDEVYEAFKTIVSQLSADEQTALFFANAARFYRFDASSSSTRLST
ncbi:amidohydrolase family protein [Bradyrhizobium sp. CCGUVB1N3]|uniref:amidohydrolase family protein n=1 Tax=Bradyrhizobium sp. CCGUVB1N3 TaxID=2949629 RepID=UPI0020B1DFEA|nr:amidohydrolase family protein [Bradyrhizobium sp. CCGUVB1N3]MCP3476835.1 amidohydrolase family protein [Bradyrhizobium sp. CCGUVB1N3]